MTENAIVQPNTCNMTSGSQMKIPSSYCTSARHANHNLAYQLSTPYNVVVVHLKNLKEKRRLFFYPHLTTPDKMKNPKPYCTSISLALSNCRIFFLHAHFIAVLKLHLSTKNNPLLKSDHRYLQISPSPPLPLPLFAAFWLFYSF